MKTVKHILTSVFLVLGLVSFAQVGVGTQNPSTTFEAVGANATNTGLTGTNMPGALAPADGVTVPRVSTNMTGTSVVGGTTAGQLVYSTFSTKEGFYYWDGDSWEPVGGSSSGGSARVADNNTITNADLNGVVIALVNRQFDLATLTPSDGDTIHFSGANSSNFGVTGAHSSAGTTPLANGGGMSFVYDAETDEWYAYNGF